MCVSVFRGTDGCVSIGLELLERDRSVFVGVVCVWMNESSPVQRGWSGAGGLSGGSPRRHRTSNLLPGLGGSNGQVRGEWPPGNLSVPGRVNFVSKPDAGGDASEHCVCVCLCGMTVSAHVNTLPLRAFAIDGCIWWRVCVSWNLSFCFCFPNGGYIVLVRE
jgi:hypothetical protein